MKYLPVERNVFSGIFKNKGRSYATVWRHGVSLNVNFEWIKILVFERGFFSSLTILASESFARETG